MTKRADKMGPSDYPTLKEIAREMEEHEKKIRDAYRRKKSELIVNTLVRVVTNNDHVNSRICGHPYGMIGIITEIDDCELEDHNSCKLYKVLAGNDEYWCFMEELEVIKVGAIIK